MWSPVGLRARILTQMGSDWQVGGEASSPSADFAVAVEAVCTELAARGESIPTRVLLASSLVVPARIDLPVTPDKPRQPAQMHELVRSEIEPSVAEFGAFWNIGAVLSAQGAMDEAARERLGLELALRREGGRSQPMRFGELALELGLIERDALERALRMQESLQSLEAEFACAWHGSKDRDGRAVWLGAAVGQRLYREWDERLKSRGMALVGALPLVGLMPAADGAGIVIEWWGEFVAAIRWQGGCITGLRVESRLERPVSGHWVGRLIEDWLETGRESIELRLLESLSSDAAANLCADLESRGGEGIVPQDGPAIWDALWQRIPLLEFGTRAWLPLVRPDRLAGPIWKRPDFIRAAVLGAALAGVAGVELTQRLRLGAIEAQFEQAEAQARQSAEVAGRQQKLIDDLNTLKRDLEAARGELAPLANEVDRLQGIDDMRKHLPELLQGLARAVGDEVVLDAVHHAADIGDFSRIKVEAWSPDYTAAHSFASRAEREVAALDYGVSQTEVRQSKGRNKQAGHQVSFWLVPVAEELGDALPARRGHP
ncbi:MAG: hypothetical protein J0L98_13625 [Zoogloea sp.]|nr:hypothetical protein [Zoogloea sp.]